MSSSSPESATCALPGLTPDGYAQWRSSELGAITEALERALVLEHLGEVAGKDVLEIGSGDGELAVRLAEMGARVSAIDCSQAMIAAGRARAAEHGVRVDFAIGRAEDLPVEDRSLDIVVAVTILCFVRDAGPVFHHIARALRPGGRLVIGELGKWSAWAAARRLRGWLGSPLWKHGHFRSPSDLRQLAQSAGLEPIAVRGTIYYPRWTWAARVLAPFDRRLGRLTNVGAAFLVLEARKPRDQR